ncbi:hypothetical protein AYO37_00035 [Opitutia bacterium SCGC AG-212-L18]|nr:hypothetical protein AYO37_00035 [Opitutae bacterium SCGC AG-212-L18]
MITKKLIIIITAILISFGISNASTKNDKIIYLFGENHRDADDFNFKEGINILTAKGYVINAREGDIRDAAYEKERIKKAKQESPFKVSSDIGIYGVEDPIFHIFKSAMYLNNSFKTFNDPESRINEAYKDKKIVTLLFLTHKNNQAFLENVWNDPILSQNPIFLFLEKNKAKLLEKDYSARFNFISNKIDRWDNDAWFDFAKRIAFLLAPKVIERIQKDKIEMLTQLLKCFEDLQDEEDCGANSQSFIYPLGLDLRNDFIIENLEKIYSITKSKNKPLICILGRRHIPEVKKGLEQKGFLVSDDKSIFIDMLTFLQLSGEL